MWSELINKLVPTVYAGGSNGCQPGLGGKINLVDCFLLNSKGETVAGVYKDPATLVNLIVNNVFMVAGIILFLMIIFAGFKLTMSGESKGKEDAKKIATSAVIGFIVMFSAYWIVQILEIVTGTEILF